MKELPSPLKKWGQDTTRWMHTLVAILLTSGACCVVWELAALHAQKPFLASPSDIYPDVFTLQTPASVMNSVAWQQVDGNVDVDAPSDDMLHLSYLQLACEEEPDAILPYHYAAPDNQAEGTNPDAKSSTSLYHSNDPRLLDELRRCPDVEIYMPKNARTVGGCAAVAGPLKFLHSRLLPHWALETKVYDVATRQKTSYFELCPNTPVLFMAPQHVLAIAKSPLWPKTKPVYLMAPGLDLNVPVPPVNFTRSVLELADVVLCRTVRCDHDIKQFLAERAAETDDDDSIKHTRVLYTSQATADPNNFAARALGGQPPSRSRADFSYARFAHTTWNISSRATQDVLNCWSSHKKELPNLDVYLLKGKYGGDQNVGMRLYKPFPGDENTKKHLWNVTKFSKDFGGASFFICPTAESDCFDLARAAGGVVVTADAYPMNEFVSNANEGVLFPTHLSTAQLQSNETSRATSDDALLLTPPLPTYSGSDLCAAVLKTRKTTTVYDRMAIATNTRRRYNEDNKFFILRMIELRAFAEHERRLLEQPAQMLRHGAD